MYKFQFLLSKDALEKAKAYKEKLKNGQATPGKYFYSVLKEAFPQLEENSADEQLKNVIQELSEESFIRYLVASKQLSSYKPTVDRPHLCTFWTSDETSILSDITMMMDVNFYNDGGSGSSFKHYKKPVKGILCHIPGLTICPSVNYASSRGTYNITHPKYNQYFPDREEVIINNNIDQDKLTALYERRLLPHLLALNSKAEQANKKVVITIPSLDNIQSTGKLDKKEVNQKIGEAIKHILSQHHKHLKHIDKVLYDGDTSEETQIGHITLINKVDKPLAYPEGTNEDSHILASVAHWDPFLWPGNHEAMYNHRGTDSNSIASDSAIKALSSNSMELLTGTKGNYSKKHAQFIPKSEMNSNHLDEHWIQRIPHDMMLVDPSRCEIHTYDKDGTKHVLSDGAMDVRLSIRKKDAIQNLYNLQIGCNYLVGHTRVSEKKQSKYIKYQKLSTIHQEIEDIFNEHNKKSPEDFSEVVVKTEVLSKIEELLKVAGTPRKTFLSFFQAKQGETASIKLFAKLMHFNKELHSPLLKLLDINIDADVNDIEMKLKDISINGIPERLKQNLATVTIST